MVSRVMNSNENHTEILIQDSEPDLNLLAGAEEMSDVNDDEENDEYDEYVGDEEDQIEWIRKFSSGHEQLVSFIGTTADSLYIMLEKLT